MKNLIILLFSFSVFSLIAQTPLLDYAFDVGGSGQNEGKDIAIDHLGNVYVTGSFSSGSDFDPGGNIYNLNPTSGSNLFISKYSNDGQFLWSVRSGGTATSYFERVKIATDTSGHVYITGLFKETVDFDPGPGVYNLTSDDENVKDMFILKIDENGAFIWVRQFKGDDSKQIQDLKIGSDGAVYTTGYFNDRVDFDPGLAAFNLDSNGARDIFISKLDMDGNFVWAKSIGGDSYDLSYALEVDKNNNVYTTGSFHSETIDFDPGTNQSLVDKIGSTDFFLLKLNSEGAFIWNKQIGGDNFGHCIGKNIIFDSNENIYITGTFERTINFDASSEAFIFGTYSPQTYLLKMDTSGLVQFAKIIFHDDDASIADLAMDSNDNIYCVGFFEDDIDFDPGPQEYYLNTIYWRNGFIQKLDSNGSFIWAGSLSGGIGQVLGIAIDEESNIFSTGNFRYQIDFDFGWEEEIVEASGTFDHFVHKMNQPCNLRPTIHSSNPKLGICPGDSSLLLWAETPAAISSASLVWNNGQTTDSVLVSPTENTIYSLFFEYNVNGLQCNGATSALVTIADSMFISTSQDLSICENEVVTFEANGGAFYNWSNGVADKFLEFIAEESQNYIVTVSDIHGCSTIDSVELTVFPAPGTPSLLSYYLIQENNPPFEISTPDLPNAIFYNWEVPTGAQIISGANSNAITINWGETTPSGSVCVKTINDCGESQNICTEVIIDKETSLQNNPHTKDYTIFPNPTATSTQIIFPSMVDGTYELRDLNGRLIRQDKLTKEIYLHLEDLESAVYILLLKTKNGVSTERIIKV